jgi:nucleoside-diphosphate-sugar epimerase
MRIAIAGCGYTGSRLAAACRAKGWAVHGATHSPESAAELTASLGITVTATDLADESSVATWAGRFETPPDVVVHCASSGRGGPAQYERVFVHGLQHLAAHFPAAKIIFTSSTSVYGQTEGEWVDESSATEPPGAGGRFLLTAESQVLARSNGLVLRLAGLYGPARCHVLARFFAGEAVIDGLDGPGRWLNHLHVDDAVSAIIHGVEKPLAGCFNVVDNEPVTQQDLLEWLAARFNTKGPERKAPDLSRKRGWTNKKVSSRALKATGWTPAFPSLIAAVEQDPAWTDSFRAPQSSEDCP